MSPGNKRGWDLTNASAEALVLAGSTKKAQVGDRIRVTRGDEVLVFEVFDLSGAGHVPPSEPHGQILRIHTEQIDKGAP